MSARLMLNQAPEIIRIIVTTHRTYSNRRTVSIHICQTSIILSILNQGYKSLVDIAFRHSRGLAGIFKTSSHIRFNSGTQCIARTEFRLTDCIDTSDSTVRRKSEHYIHIEVIPIGLIRLNIKVIAYSFINTVKILPLADILRIKTVSHENKINSVVLVAS